MSKLNFDGRVFREPRVVSKLRIGLPPTANPEATNRVLVIGPSEGGLPVGDDKVYTFGNVSEAREVLRSGDALRAIGFIFNPSPTFRGAGEVDFIRSDTAVAASTTLSDGTGAALTITSVDKGTWNNLIQVTVAVSGAGRTITAKIPDLSIQSGADAALVGSVLTSASAKFKSRGARIGDYIYLGNGTAGSNIFTILTVDSETQVTLATAPTAGTGVTWNHFVYASTLTSETLNTNSDIAGWITANLGAVLTATVGTAVLPIAATKNLSGGTVTIGGTAEITSSLTLARDLDVQHIYVARACGAGAGELEFAGLVRGHILNDAEVPAIGFIGAGIGETSDQAVIYAATLNSARLVYCYQNVLEPTLDGLTTETLGGFMLAAKACGLAAGLPPEVPLTRKPINVLGLVPATGDSGLDKTKREKLLKAGVFHVFQQPGTNEFVVNQGISTLQKQDNLWDNSTSTSPEISLMRSADNLLYSLKKTADTAFIGSNASIGKATVENFTRSFLESQRGLLLIDWKNIVVTQSGDQWRVEFGFVPNYPVNYIIVIGTVIA